MTTVLHSAGSVAHVAAAGVALVSGTLAQLAGKSTRAHRRAGRLYVASLAVALGTAFRLYFLFGRFGIVHWGAVGCGLALLLGTGAVAARHRLPAWRQWHYLGMGASLTGLYATLLVESTYRFFPVRYFWWVTLLPAGAVLLAGGWHLWRHRPGRVAGTGQAN